MKGGRGFAGRSCSPSCGGCHPLGGGEQDRLLNDLNDTTRQRPTISSRPLWPLALAGSRNSRKDLGQEGLDKRAKHGARDLSFSRKVRNFAAVRASRSAPMTWAGGNALG